MQHNWIPTRLLDWSENLGIAVYFAVKYNDRKADMAIYLLDPLGLNRYSQKDAIPIIPDEPMGLDYVTQYLKKNPYPPQFPMAIRPNFSNDRMVAQRGLFTIHGDELTPIEQLCPRAITKVTVSKDVIEHQRVHRLSRYQRRLRLHQTYAGLIGSHRAARLVATVMSSVPPSVPHPGCPCPVRAPPRLIFRKPFSPATENRACHYLAKYCPAAPT
jgi:hypothetical protein